MKKIMILLVAIIAISMPEPVLAQGRAKGVKAFVSVIKGGKTVTGSTIIHKTPKLNPLQSRFKVEQSSWIVPVMIDTSSHPYFNPVHAATPAVDLPQPSPPSSHLHNSHSSVLTALEVYRASMNHLEENTPMKNGPRAVAVLKKSQKSTIIQRKPLFEAGFQLKILDSSILSFMCPNNSALEQ